MNWKDVELIFNRSISFSFSRKKFLFIFPMLLLCGVVVVLFRMMAFGKGSWITMSLGFLPVFLCSGILLAAGIILIRIYHHEVKGKECSYKNVIRQSKDLMISIVYFSVPMVIVYLCLWILLGVFCILQAIPAVGNVIGVLLSFGPFILVLGSFLLGFLNVLVLFYITPAIALQSDIRFEMAKETLDRFRKNIFTHVAAFIVGFMPLVLVVGLLCLTAFVTDAEYLATEHNWSVSLQWFFMMLPFCAALAPVITFFFNFAAESYVWMKRQLAADHPDV